MTDFCDLNLKNPLILAVVLFKGILTHAQLS